MKYLIMILIAMPVVWASEDFNGLGFNAYEKGQYEKALGLFKEAIKKSSLDSFAWLNMGRTIVAINGINEPKDYCAFESNWIYSALAAMTKAADINAAQVVAKLDATNEANFKTFKKKNEYKKWRIALNPLPKSDQEIAHFLQTNPEWVSRSLGRIPSTIEYKRNSAEIAKHVPDSLEKWTWKTHKGFVKLSLNKKQRAFKLKSINSFFDQGKRSLRKLVLEEENGENETWELGPSDEDCE